MFASYRSTEVWASPEESHPVDSLGAQMVERAVARLGAVQRSALRWHYIKPVSPHRLAQALGLTKAGLAQAVIDARSHVQSLLTHRVNPVSSP